VIPPLSIHDNNSILQRHAPVRKYVGFVDILGFGRQVENDFDATLKIYTDVLDSAEFVRQMRPDVKIQVVSDAFIVTAEHLSRMIGVLQALHMRTLIHDCLVRGGIGHGLHIEATEGDNNYVVSQGLVQAVRLEKNGRFPCVAVHESIDIPLEWWKPSTNPFTRGLLYFEGLRIVNPFNLVWGQSAMTRVWQLLQRFPEHRDKYDWFLRLYQAVITGDPLVPPS
jgi:hypothetical protein